MSGGIPYTLKEIYRIMLSKDKIEKKKNIDGYEYLRCSFWDEKKQKYTGEYVEYVFGNWLACRVLIKYWNEV